MGGTVYQARHGRHARRVKNEDHSYPQPRADISHLGISSRSVTFDRHGRRAVIAALGALAILDGALFLLIGLR